MEKSRNPFKEKMMDVPNLCVRKLLPEEVPLLTDLYAYRDAEDMIRENTAKIQTGQIAVWGLYTGGELIGELRTCFFGEEERFCSLGRRAYLYAFRVKPAFQKRGFGTHLLQTVLSALTQEGYSQFTVGVEDENLCARRMYERQGFCETIGRIRESYQGVCYEYDLLLKQ